MPLVAQLSGFCEYFHYTILAAIKLHPILDFICSCLQIKLPAITQHVLFVAIFLNATLGTKYIDA